jgi:hypothetical protein
MLYFLNLVLFSDDDSKYYTKMYDILNRYYKTFEHHKSVYVRTVFYAYREQEEEYILDEGSNILYIKGDKEGWHNYTKTIIQKTLKAFEYFKDDLINFDYVIRNNISTIVDFSLLVEELEKNPIQFYGGGIKNCLQWKGGGVEEDKWFGTEYIQGTSIIFTADAIKHIIDNKSTVNTNIVDDVSIGIFMNENFPNIKIQDLSHKYVEVPIFVVNNYINTAGIYNMILNKYIFYRNKCRGIFCNDRNLDIQQMGVISEILLQKEKNPIY